MRRLSFRNIWRLTVGRSPAATPSGSMCSSRTDLAFIYPTPCTPARQRASADPARLKPRTEPGGKLWEQIKDVLCNRALKASKHCAQSSPRGWKSFARMHDVRSISSVAAGCWLEQTLPPRLLYRCNGIVDITPLRA